MMRETAVCCALLSVLPGCATRGSSGAYSFPGIASSSGTLRSPGVYIPPGNYGLPGTYDDDPFRQTKAPRDDDRRAREARERREYPEPVMHQSTTYSGGQFRNCIVFRDGGEPVCP